MKKTYQIPKHAIEHAGLEAVFFENGVFWLRQLMIKPAASLLNRQGLECTCHGVYLGHNSQPVLIATKEGEVLEPEKHQARSSFGCFLPFT